MADSDSPVRARVLTTRQPVSRAATADLVAEVMRRAPICPRDNIPMLGLASRWFFCTVCRRTVDFDDEEDRGQMSRRGQ